MNVIHAETTIEALTKHISTVIKNIGETEKLECMKSIREKKSRIAVPADLKNLQKKWLRNFRNGRGWLEPLASVESILRVQLQRLIFFTFYYEANYFSKIYGRDLMESLRVMLFGRTAYDLLKTHSYPKRRILITGETGSGKEQIASILQIGLKGSLKEMLRYNITEINDETSTSQLFGHEKGSFTGADKRHKGVFETLSGQTFFLDEIGRANKLIQARLLRILEHDEVIRLGSNKPVEVKPFHLITATSISEADLRGDTREVKQDSFLPDLYYRLSDNVIRLAPLREILSDKDSAKACVSAIWEHEKRTINTYMKDSACNQDNSKEVGRVDMDINWFRESDTELPMETAVTEAVLDELQGYTWQGNLREFSQYLYQCDLFGVEHATSALLAAQDTAGGKSAVDSKTMSTLKIKKRIETLKLDLYKRAFDQTHTMEEAAKKLGVSRQSVSKYWKQMGLVKGKI